MTHGFAVLRAVTAHYSSMHAAVKMLATRIDLLIQLLQQSSASAPHLLSNTAHDHACRISAWQAYDKAWQEQPGVAMELDPRAADAW